MKKLSFLDPDFLEKIKSLNKEDLDSTVVYARVDTNIEKASSDLNDREVKFIISSAAIDRHDDTIRVSGWDLKNYKKNPVVLWGHKQDLPPIGKARKVYKEGKGEDALLKAITTFLPEDFAEDNHVKFANMIYKMVMEGFLNSTSVGFRPLELELPEDENRGFYAVDFKKQELLEYSVVPVPANPEAIIDAKAKGIDTSPYGQWLERELDENASLIVPRKTLEDTYSTFKGTSVQVEEKIEAEETTEAPEEDATEEAGEEMEVQIAMLSKTLMEATTVYEKAFNGLYSKIDELSERIQLLEEQLSNKEKTVLRLTPKKEDTIKLTSNELQGLIASKLKDTLG